MTTQPRIAVQAADLSKQFQHRGTSGRSLKERVTHPGRHKPTSFWALHRVSFEVPAGGTFGIIGPNGSGKSSLLKVLAGIYRPTSGQIRVNGRVSALLELGAGFHPDLTGRENILINGAILGMSRAEVAESVDQIIEMSQIGDFIDDPVRMYSSGMRMRLGFSVAVAVQPDILMVDEVISVGDESFRIQCLEHFANLRNRGATVIVVSHALGLIRDLCDQAMLINEAEVAAIGEPASVIEQYREIAASRTEVRVRETRW